MLRIDHIPIAFSDRDRLARLFERLGFSVSGPCAYTTSDRPEERWACRAVFLQGGWLDLQAQPNWPEHLGASPHSCLFREDDDADLVDLRMGEPSRLTRTWDEAPDRETDLVWRSILERIAPVVLAAVAYPTGDLDQANPPIHANSAVALLGLTFGAAEPGAGAPRAAERLDLSGFQFLTADDFSARFGASAGPPRAVRVAVRSLKAASDALSAGRLAFKAQGQRLFVPVQDELGCGVEFEVRP